MYCVANIIINLKRFNFEIDSFSFLKICSMMPMWVCDALLKLKNMVEFFTFNATFIKEHKKMFE